jgi:uncharacterized protein YjiS (DUF1127 family)
MFRLALFVTPRSAGAGARVIGRAVDAVAAAWEAQIRRWATRDLLGLDDHMLKDIGLSRGDIHEALNSTAADPTSLLAETARRRRAAEWAREAGAMRRPRAASPAQPLPGAGRAA